MATEPSRTYPSDLPVLALRQTVVFPLTVQPLAINRPASIESVNRALTGDRGFNGGVESIVSDRQGWARLIVSVGPDRVLPCQSANIVVRGTRAAPDRVLKRLGK